jgi:hypothetical protein
MRAYFNMPTSEFVGQLRDIAIKAGARPQVIDCLDAITEAPSEDEIDLQITEAVEQAEKEAFENGKLEGENDKENAIENALKEQYADICKAIEAKGKEIGLTDEQVYKVVNHILWDCWP